MAVRERLRLGVNIDHVATLRNARGLVWPDPLRAALLAEASGADTISAHLRLDRRHIQDADLVALRAGLGIPLNIVCSPTPGMEEILLALKPQGCCLVPEGLANGWPGTAADAADTPSGGDDAAAVPGELVAALREAGIRVSLCVTPEAERIGEVARVGAQVVKLHTGAWSALHATGQQAAADQALCDLRSAAKFAHSLGLEVQAGHGLTYENVEPVATIPELRELQIGHFLIGEAVYIGLGPAIEEMRRRIDAARDW